MPVLIASAEFRQQRNQITFACKFAIIWDS